jgi:hypothetical protein
MGESKKREIRVQKKLSQGTQVHDWDYQTSRSVYSQSTNERGGERPLSYLEILGASWHAFIAAETPPALQCTSQAPYRL